MTDSEVDNALALASMDNWPFPTHLPPNRPVPPMPFNPDNYEDAPL